MPGRGVGLDAGLVHYEVVAVDFLAEQAGLERQSQSLPVDFLDPVGHFRVGSVAVLHRVHDAPFRRVELRDGGQLVKRAPGESRSDEELDSAIRQIVSRAIASEGVSDIFAAAGLDKPDISVLSDDFLAEMQQLPQRNLAVEALQRLLRGELNIRRRKNVVESRSFAEMLEQTLVRYRNRTIEAAQVIEELIKLAHEMREASARGERLGLSDDELAFYDALATNDSAVQVLGDEQLRVIARELVETVRKNISIDWTLREDVRANLRRMVRRTLNRHGYPPDQQDQAVRTVIEQAELFPESGD